MCILFRLQTSLQGWRHRIFQKGVGGGQIQFFVLGAFWCKITRIFQKRGQNYLFSEKRGWQWQMTRHPWHRDSAATASLYYFTTSVIVDAVSSLLIPSLNPLNKSSRHSTKSTSSPALLLFLKDNFYFLIF